MEFKIDKKSTTVAMFGEVAEIVRKLRKNGAVQEDMKTCIAGIDKISGHLLFGKVVKLDGIELFAVTEKVQFCLKAEVTGWLCRDEKVREFIAKLRIYGEITDNGEYFAWDQSKENGAPADFNARLYIEE